MKQLRFTTLSDNPIAQMLGLNMPAVSEEEIFVHGGKITEREGEMPKRSTTSFDKSFVGVVPDFEMAFIDGDSGQFDLPRDEQNILLILPKGKAIQCVAIPDPEDDDNYIIHFKNESDRPNAESVETTSQDGHNSEPVASEVTSQTSEG